MKEQITLTETRTIIIDSIGGQSERAWWGGVSPSLKATHYKFPPCIVALRETNETDNIDRETVLRMVHR